MLQDLIRLADQLTEDPERTFTRAGCYRGLVSKVTPC
jgi:hypothetical protein